MKPRTVSEAEKFTKLIKTQQHMDFIHGDLVKIEGIHGKFIFDCFVMNEETGQFWYDVFEPDTKAYRSFSIGKVRSIKIAKRNRTS